MIDERAGRRYALAAFEAAQAAGAIKEVEEDLITVSGVFNNDARLKAFFLSPDTARDRKIEAFDKAFSGAHPLTRQLFRVMLEKRREGLINAVRVEFENLRRTQTKTIKALVTSAAPLDFGTKERLEARLVQSLGHTVEADYAVDSALVGGLRVTYGGYVLDGSVRGRFRRLRESLRADAASATANANMSPNDFNPTPSL